jgi:hydrogenase expression/formation protein HypE
MMKIEKISLAYGSGGRLTNELIENFFVKNFSNPLLNELEDSALLNIKGNKIAFTTDSYVVNPMFFPGGDIGRIAVCGTVNDLSVKGALPLYISCGFIIEEGLDFSILERIVLSMKKAAKEANVKIVTGDTKVVEKGKVDKVFINTSGIGLIDKSIDISSKNLKGGEIIIINGEIASHGMAVMNERNNLQIEGDIKSDAAPLNDLIGGILREVKVKTLRDVTRGGLATILNEVSQKCHRTIEIYEKDIPVSKSVKSACSILGIDPLYVANEGKCVIFADEIYADKILNIMKKHKYGRKATIIGRVLKENSASVQLITLSGFKRQVVMLEGDQLPRIC